VRDGALQSDSTRQLHSEHASTKSGLTCSRTGTAGPLLAGALCRMKTWCMPSAETGSAALCRAALTTRGCGGHMGISSPRESQYSHLVPRASRLVPHPQSLIKRHGMSIEILDVGLDRYSLTCRTFTPVHVFLLCPPGRPHLSPSLSYWERQQAPAVAMESRNAFCAISFDSLERHAVDARGRTVRLAPLQAPVSELVVTRSESLPLDMSRDTRHV
jgi:hypothetical protein